MVDDDVISDFYNRLIVGADDGKENRLEDLAPPLRMIMHLRSALQKGQSVRFALIQYLQFENEAQGFFGLNANDHFRDEVRKWFALREQNKPTTEIENRQISNFRRGLLKIIDRGLRGESINEMLFHYQAELIRACEERIDQHCKEQGFYLLLPLLFLQFPGMLILLFGPILQNLINSMTRM